MWKWRYNECSYNDFKLPVERDAVHTWENILQLMILIYVVWLLELRLKSLKGVLQKTVLHLW